MGESSKSIISVFLSWEDSVMNGSLIFVKTNKSLLNSAASKVVRRPLRNISSWKSISANIPTNHYSSKYFTWVKIKLQILGGDKTEMQRLGTDVMKQFLNWHFSLNVYSVHPFIYWGISEIRFGFCFPKRNI